MSRKITIDTMHALAERFGFEDYCDTNNVQILDPETFEPIPMPETMPPKEPEYVTIGPEDVSIPGLTIETTHTLRLPDGRKMKYVGEFTPQQRKELKEYGFKDVTGETKFKALQFLQAAINVQ